MLKSAPLILSIVAGVTTNNIESMLERNVPIVRVMPNTPALLGCGASSLYANLTVSRQQKEMAEHIMRKTGVAVWVDKEAQIDVVTAISGSGPAYFFLMMERLIDEAVSLGLDKKKAELLVAQTALGAANMAMQAQEDIHVLRQQVTSKGGVTEAALNTFAHHEFSHMIKNVLKSNMDRSLELSQLNVKTLEKPNVNK